MTTAREEAERRFPFPGRNAFVSELNAAREAFISGAQWQAKQPVEITDEMIEKVARALGDAQTRWSCVATKAWEWFTNTSRKRLRSEARAALEAALSNTYHGEEHR